MLTKWQDWTNSTASEVDFWNRWVSSRGLHWPEDFARRTDPAQPLPELVEDQLRGAGVPEGSAVRVLDVGSGPLTMVGSASQRYQVAVTAVDPLADEYNRILTEGGVPVPNPAAKGFAETLDRQFDAESFDLVWCCNALDHSFDPVMGITKMLAVVKPGQPVILMFHPNEADGGNYNGLHQWNFDLDANGDFTIEQRGKMINLTRLLASQVSMKAWRIDGQNNSKSRVAVVLRRLGDFSLTQLLLSNPQGDAAASS